MTLLESEADLRARDPSVNQNDLNKRRKRKRKKGGMCPGSRKRKRRKKTTGRRERKRTKNNFLETLTFIKIKKKMFPAKGIKSLILFSRNQNLEMKLAKFKNGVKNVSLSIQSLPKKFKHRRQRR